MLTLEPQDLGWVAGFYEGEATIGVSGGRRGCALQIAVSQKDAEPLYRLQELTGVGNVRPPLACRPTYVWTIARVDEVTEFIHAIFPLLSRRRQRQILKVIQRCNARRRSMAPLQRRRPHRITV